MRFTFFALLTMILALPAVAAAQEPSPFNPQAMQQLLNSQRINLKQYRDNSTITCREQEFLSCNAGYSCSALEPNGRTSNIEIIGRKGEQCLVNSTQPGGTTAKCSYSSETMQILYSMYQQDSIGMGDALAVGQRVMNECEMFDAKGNALGKPVINPKAIKVN